MLSLTLAAVWRGNKTEIKFNKNRKNLNVFIEINRNLAYLMQNRFSPEK